MERTLVLLVDAQRAIEVVARELKENRHEAERKHMWERVY